MCPSRTTTISTTWSTSPMEKNVDPEFKAHNYLEPIVRSGIPANGFVDKWIVYGTVDGKQLFSALTDGPSGPLDHDQGSRRLRADRGSGQRPDRRARRG